MTFQSLLPPASSEPLELVLEQSLAEFSPLPVPNDTLWNPDTCPVHMLDWLAVSLSVDLWRSTWPVWKKRQVCRDAIAAARLKGTLAGLRKFLDFADADITQVVTPPVKLFAGKSYTKEELDRFYAVMPELRIYPNRSRNRNVFGKMFAGRGVGPGRFALASVARTGRRTYVFDPLDSSLTELITLQIEERAEEQVAIQRTRVVTPGLPGNAFFAGSHAGRHLGKVRTPSTVRTFNVDLTYLHKESPLRLTTIEPSFEPLDTRHERGHETWAPRGGKLYAGRGAGRFVCRSDAWLHTFTKVRLYDGKRTPALRHGARWFAGMRLGNPAHTASIRVKITIPHRKRTAFAGFHANSVYARSVNTSIRDTALEAVHASKAAHEKILVSFQNRREPTFGDAILLDGSRTFGDLYPRR
jgi:P2-related tail formation protein